MCLQYTINRTFNRYSFQTVVNNHFLEMWDDKTPCLCKRVWPLCGKVCRSISVLLI